MLWRTVSVDGELSQRINHLWCTIALPPLNNTRSYSDQVDGVLTHPSHDLLRNTRIDVFTSTQTRLTYNFVKQCFSQTSCSLYHTCGFLQIYFLSFKIIHFIVWFTGISLIPFRIRLFTSKSNVLLNVQLVMRRSSDFHQHLMKFVYRRIFMHDACKRSKHLRQLKCISHIFSKLIPIHIFLSFIWCKAKHKFVTFGWL